jgi:hypothetical protein
MTLAALLVSVGVGALGAPEEPVQAPVPIEGTVVDADRRPAGGVGVFFSDFKGRSGRGGIVGHVETDAQGRFRLQVPAAPDSGPEPGILWAYRPGSLIASYSVDRDTVPPGWPVSMVIDAPTRAEFLVRGPDGRPVAGARIQPVALNGPPYHVPEGLGERIAERTITDARGRVVLTALFPEEVVIVTVSAPGLGRQRYEFLAFAGSRKPRIIELSPVDRVEGRIVADDPMLAVNRKLVAVFSDRPGRPRAESLTTDREGRFTIPEAPDGGERGPTVDDIRETFLIRVLTVIDPARAAVLIEALPDDPDLELNPRINVKNNARLDLVTMLGNPPSDRWDQWVVRRLLHLWIVGDENDF